MLLRNKQHCTPQVLVGVYGRTDRRADGRTDARTFSRNGGYVTLLLFKIGHIKIKVSHKRNKRHWTNVNSRKKCHITTISWARTDGYQYRCVRVCVCVNSITLLQNSNIIVYCDNSKNNKYVSLSSKIW
jgi:hypothetical protein